MEREKILLYIIYTKVLGGHIKRYIASERKTALTHLPAQNYEQYERVQLAHREMPECEYTAYLSL